MTFDRVARKIKRPPAAQNWVRLNAYGDVLKTTNLIVKFALGIPSFNYNPGTKACHDKVCLNLDLRTAVKSARRSGSPAGWDSNESFVRAFYDFDSTVEGERDGYAESFDYGAFRVSREVVVPTRPSFTTRKSGLLIPSLLCGWKNIPFDDIELRLFMTVLESGLFSYADYRRSAGQVILFPVSADGQRQPHIIRRGDYKLLSASELRDQSALYVEAQMAALPIAEQLWHEREAKRQSDVRPGFPDVGLLREPDLFEG